MRGAARELYAAFAAAAHSTSSEELVAALAEVATAETGALALLGEPPPCPATPPCRTSPSEQHDAGFVQN